MRRITRKVKKETVKKEKLGKAKIFFEGHFIDYPIEYSVKQISKFDMEIVNILYIGADGRYNLGDDILYKQFNDKIGKKLKLEGLGYRITPLRTFPTADPVLSPCNVAKNQIINWNDIDLVVLGGGSSIMDQYLCQFSFTNLERFPNIPIVIWGSGFDDLLLLISLSISSIKWLLSIMD